jgi:hypothetical protein
VTSLRHLVDCLAGRGDRFAVASATQPLSYRVLAERVAASADELGGDRRLVLIEAHNDLPTLIHYLGALAGNHAVMPVPPGCDHTALLDAYDPDVIIDGTGTVHVRRRGSVHRLHPDLALLLSTSGSTGSPKLVRLSHTNLAANADAIAEYLDIRESDRAATTLPLSYCYGLSVIHSHLLRGAGIILTDRSVVDDEFWELFGRHRGTTFAGVPYTFELLDRVGFATMELPHLRYVTQAGGRLHPERVRRFADLGHRMGWQLFVMYGATEATARMAYLPAELAQSRPGSIGLPIPGGSLSIEPLDGGTDPDVGELIYRGPNVMMGYAHSPVDLALGKTVDTLRTGDIARRDADGLFEVIGRSSRFVKLYGVRIDLQRLEAILSERGIAAFCTEDDDRLIVAVTGDHDGEVRRLAAATGLPPTAITVVSVAELPMLACGKPDYPAVRDIARESATPARAVEQPVTDLYGLFAEVLQIDRRAIGAVSSFIELGGDSLSYVTMSVRLERALGRLPADWHRTPLHRLERAGRSRPWFGATLETSVALRAAAIVLIVGSHAGLFHLWGGAHILLGIAGYNFGRFCLTPVPQSARVRHLRRTIAWIAVPSVTWIAVCLALTDDYHATNLLLANKILGPFDSMTAGRLWFVEVLVWILIALAALCSLPVSDRLERRHPFAIAAAFLAFGLALRYDLFGFDEGRDAWFSPLAFWFFAVGWAAAKASATWQRVAVTLVFVGCVHGYFASGPREALVIAGFLLLIWLPAVRCPGALTVGAGAVAEASLYTYLTHFQVYPLFEGDPLAGVIASITVGLVVMQLVSAVRKHIPERRDVHVRCR